MNNTGKNNSTTCQFKIPFLSSLYVLGLSVLCLLSFSSCDDKKKDVDKNKPTGPVVLSADGFLVKTEPFQSDYTASGSLVPNEEIQILSEVPGRVTSISFTEGAQVKKGQVLVRLYNEDIKAQILKSKAQRELQEKIKARQSELLRIGGISQQDFETTTAQIASIDADIAYTEAMLRRTTIVAPFNGTIGIRNISMGAVVTAATPIASLQQTQMLKMDFNLPDQYRDEITMGKKISFNIAGKLDTFSATITAIEPSANAVTRTLKVRAMVKNDNHKLIPGAFTHIIIPFENNKSAILIPSQAIIPTNRDKQVAVVKNGKAKLVVVKIGMRTNDKVEIIQGLAAGDTIITTGTMQVKPNMAVKVKMNTAK